jgi:hypothetical protein
MQRGRRHPCQPRGVGIPRQFSLIARIADPLLERPVEIVQCVAQQPAHVRVQRRFGQRRADQEAAARPVIARQVE